MDSRSCSSCRPSIPSSSVPRGADPFAPGDDMVASLAGRFVPMDAMVRVAGSWRLVAAVLPMPEPTFGEVLLEVRATTVCDVERHVHDVHGLRPGSALVPGHELVGVVVATGDGVDMQVGTRVGVTSLGWACGRCRHCRAGCESLCERAEITGYHRDGGFAQLAVADARYCHPLSSRYDDARAAALLCAGMLAYQALCAAGAHGVIGVVGFGPEARLMAQLARQRGQEVRVFGDAEEGRRARAVGATWVDEARVRDDSASDVVVLFPEARGRGPVALSAVRPRGMLISAGASPSALLTAQESRGERVVRIAGSVTRPEVSELLSLADALPLQVDVATRRLAHANDALCELREGRVSGSLVITSP